MCPSQVAQALKAILKDKTTNSAVKLREGENCTVCVFFFFLIFCWLCLILNSTIVKVIRLWI